MFVTGFVSLLSLLLSRSRRFFLEVFADIPFPLLVKKIIIIS